MSNWIAGAIKHPGALHREMGVPQGQPIPAGRLAHAAQQGGELGRRARFAEELKGFHHRALGGPVMPGHGYIVGERGPEAVVPQAPGRVVPHQALIRAAIMAKLHGMGTQPMMPTHGTMPPGPLR